jgi:hypothetical protein
MTVVRPLPRSHPLPFLFTGLLVLAASVWVFLLILRGVYGRIVLADFVPSKENLSMVFTKRKIGILESRYSDLILPEGSAWLHDNVNTWKKFLASTVRRRQSSSTLIKAAACLPLVGPAHSRNMAIGGDGNSFRKFLVSSLPGRLLSSKRRAYTPCEATCRLRVEFPLGIHSE